MTDLKNENSENNEIDYELLLKEKNNQIRRMEEEIKILKKSIGIIPKKKNQK